MRARSGVGAFLVVGAAIASAREARAQDTSQKAMAEALFQQGIALFDQGKTHEACGRFEESQHLDPKLSTLFNLATCHDKEGRTASAWQEFTEAAALADHAKDTDSAKRARGKATELAAKLSTVKLTHSTDAPVVTLTLDKKNLDAGMVGAPLPMDPGTHHLEVSATGYVTWTHDFDVGPGPLEVPIDIPGLQKNAAPIEAPPRTRRRRRLLPRHFRESRRPNLHDEPKPHPVPVGVVVAYSIAGAALVGAIATGGASFAMTKKLVTTTTSKGTFTSDPNYGTALSLAHASDALYPIGAIAAVVGTALVIVDVNAHSNDEKSHVSIIGVGDVGAGVRVRF